MGAAEMIGFHLCMHCNTLDTLAIDTCAKCLHTEMETILIPGTGKLVSWTTIRKPPLRFKSDGIYHVGVFDLDNGFRVTGRFLPSEDDQLGDRVIAVPTLSSEHATPTFKVDKNV